MSRTTRLIRFTRHWHARIGVLAALFFMFLALTGLALNHTGALRLDSRAVSTPWLMHWYGLRAETPSQGYVFERGYFTWNDQYRVMDGRPLAGLPGPVIGAVEVAGVRYIATPSTLYLYQPDGSLVDKLSGSALPSTPLHHIGKLGDALLIEGRQGAFSSTDALSWQQADPALAERSEAQPLPAEVRRQIEPLFAPSLPLERVLLDVHSGRIFGSHGPLAMDLAALLLLALSISGIWIYLRSIRRRGGHHG